MSDTCNKCTKPIGGKIITALEKKWHPECFACVECKKPIDGSFHEKDGKIYCAKDFLKNHSSKCHSCKKPIEGKIIKALDACWHEEHFVCKKCKQQLAGLSFMEKDGDPFCNTCYTDKFAARCEKCKKPIDGKSIIAFQKKWHPDCFLCGACSKPVTESSFQVENGKPLCGKCSS